MIEWIIRRSVANRFLVMMGALFLSIWGTWTIINTPVDALPDLSDVQVIIKTSYPGQAPQIVENQVTYPLTTTMLSVPGAKTVRGFSQFGDSSSFSRLLIVNVGCFPPYSIWTDALSSKLSATAFQAKSNC